MTKLNVVPMDNKACGYYRLIYPAQAMYNFTKVNIAPPLLFSGNKGEWVWTARVCNADVFKVLLEFKQKNNVKIAIDYDDNLWEEPPAYNRCNIKWKENNAAMKEYLGQLADLVIVSTDELAESIHRLGYQNTVVMKNCLEYNRWRFDYYEPSANLNFFYAGSATHWSPDSYGDFTPELVKYLRNKEVNVLGTNPTFLPSSRNVCKWVDINSYPTVFARHAMKSKFVIAPLQDNLFNRCKSDLKYLECAAVGRVCLCSDVGEYMKVAHPMQIIPNDADFNKIEYIVNRATKHYNEIIQHQYKVLNERWLNPQKYIELFSK